MAPKLAFERIAKTRIAVATVGPYRLQLWDELRDCYHGPVDRVRWGAAAFERTAIGCRRISPDRFFGSRDEAISHLAMISGELER